MDVITMSIVGLVIGGAAFLSGAFATGYMGWKEARYRREIEQQWEPRPDAQPLSDEQLTALVIDIATVPSLCYWEDEQDYQDEERVEFTYAVLREQGYDYRGFWTGIQYEQPLEVAQAVTKAATANLRIKQGHKKAPSKRYTVDELREMCSAKGIKWRDANGARNKHLRKEQMLSALGLSTDVKEELPMV